VPASSGPSAPGGADPGEGRVAVVPVAAPASVRSVWAPPTGTNAPGVYVPGAPPWPDPSRPGPLREGAPVGEPRDRRFGRGIIALAVIVAVVVFSIAGIVIGTRSHRSTGRTDTAGGTGAAGAGPTTGRSAPGSTPSGSTSSVSGANSIALGDGQALIGKIVPPPAGAHAYGIDDSSAGVMTVQQYAHHYFNGSATELDRLRQEGFQVAASTDYVRSDGIEIATHLVQFADSTGAQEYFDVERSAWVSEGGVTMFSVPATPDAVGYDVAKVDSLGNRRTVMYEHVGNVVVVVNVYTPHKIDRAADVKVMQSQLVPLD
jgi:hypothetical protein